MADGWLSHPGSIGTNRQYVHHGQDIAGVGFNKHYGQDVVWLVFYCGVLAVMSYLVRSMAGW